MLQTGLLAGAQNRFTACPLHANQVVTYGQSSPRAVPAAGMMLILGVFPFFESLLTFFSSLFHIRFFHRE